MQSAQDIIALIEADTWLMTLLRAVEALQAPDCWIAAGAIRNPIWAQLHNHPFDPNNELDVDVIYFDPSDTPRTQEAAYEVALGSIVPDANWQVRNQARMHKRNHDAPYRDSSHALEHWAETATAIGARLEAGKIELLTPYGIDDLLGLIVRQTPKFMNKRQIYEARILDKGWSEQWPLLTII